jgi:hypothetical protein
MKKHQRLLKHLLEDACPGAEVHLFQTTKNVRVTVTAQGRSLVSHMSVSPSRDTTVLNEVRRIRHAYAALVSGENPHARRAKGMGVA